VQLRFLERWISLLRLVAIPCVVAAVTVARYPRTGPWERWAWITTAAFVVGSLCFFVLARSSVGQRHQMAERRTVEELRRLSRLRSDFVSMVSHDVRTPLAAVIGSARTLEQRWRELSPEQRDRFLALIADETARMAALVAEVTDTSRIDQGTFSYTFGEVDVGALVDDAVAAAEIARSEANIESAVEAGLPHIDGDSVRLRQLLTNLIDNAVKYSPEGAPVDVRAEAVNGHIRVDVVDRGSGVAPRDQRLIFERFGRVPGTSKPGTGLGLYIARAIAEAHGGDLRVSSKLGEGSTFTLDLPARRKS
jgi:two-component system, OmpR family, phosphate regulon sensor histidine kinase PhoR